MCQEVELNKKKNQQKVEQWRIPACGHLTLHSWIYQFSEEHALLIVTRTQERAHTTCCSLYRTRFTELGIADITNDICARARLPY